jgi:uncharacterized protein YuzE
MKLTYDPKHNIAYIQLREKTAEVETIHLSDELLIDVAPDGTVYGMEFLNANDQLGASVIVEGGESAPSTIPLPS